jgi:hypothetical protein
MATLTHEKDDNAKRGNGICPPPSDRRVGDQSYQDNSG